MIWNEAATIAKDWQESIAALIGFAGIIITLVVNARIQRRHQKDAEDDAKKSLRDALMVEFELLQSSLEGNFSKTGDTTDNQGSMLVPKEPLRSFVFGAPNTNLGILGPVVTAAVVNARLTYEELHRGFALFATHGEFSRHFVIPMSNVPLLFESTEHVIEEIKKALRALKLS